MAITNCSTCDTTSWRSVSVDETGTLAICSDGHYNFEAGGSDTGVETGGVTVTGQSAIGSGAIAIGHDGDWVL